MLQTLLLALHVIVAIALIAFILLQQGRGANTGAAFGSGASSTVFGARGSASLLSRTTAILAVVFFTNCLLLAFLGGQRHTATSIVEHFGTQPAPETAPAGTAPAATAPSVPGTPTTEAPTSPTVVTTKSTIVANPPALEGTAPASSGEPSDVPVIPTDKPAP